MKFSMLTIAGALAAANAASTTRGVSTKTLKKMAAMQQFTVALNKKAFGGFTRHLQDEDENQEGQDQNMEYEDEEELSDETVVRPHMCVTAKVYDGENEENQNQNNWNQEKYEYGGNYNADEEADAEANANYANANGNYQAKPTVSYLSFNTATVEDNDGYEYYYGNKDEYMTTLSSYLQAIGSSWAEERAQLCDDCMMLEGFCQMTENERQEFSEMDEDEFEQYMNEYREEMEYEMEQGENGAYAAYNYQAAQEEDGGRRLRRRLYQPLQNVCGTCQEKCIDEQQMEQSKEYYEEMEKLFEEAMCTETDDGYYIGHTCGSDGKSIELALFNDEDCMYMAGEQDAYSLYQQAVAMVYGDGDADGDGEQDYDWSADDLAYGYMNMVTEMFSDDYSCSLGAVRNYDGAEPSEACENLYENAVSKSDCMANMYQEAEEQAEQEQEEGQNYYNNQYQYNGEGAEGEEGQQYGNGYAYVPEGYDMIYSEDIADVCGNILQLEANMENSGWTNPFSGKTFQELFLNSGLSGGAIAGIVIAVIAVIAAIAAASKKKIDETKKKSELEEPVFQGGDLS